MLAGFCPGALSFGGGIAGGLITGLMAREFQGIVSGSVANMLTGSSCTTLPDIEAELNWIPEMKDYLGRNQ